MKIGYEPASLENAGHSQIAGKQNEQEKQSMEVQTSEGGLTLGNVKPMDPPIYSPPSKFRVRSFQKTLDVFITRKRP